ncbi:hypothetical protein MRX96_005441 [Rhipicephalus microplus]
MGVCPSPGATWRLCVPSIRPISSAAECAAFPATDSAATSPPLLTQFDDAGSVVEDHARANIVVTAPAAAAVVGGELAPKHGNGITPSLVVLDGRYRD